MRTTHTITTTSLEDAVTHALTMLLVRDGAGERSTPVATLVFSGEGATATDAARDALGDLSAQCIAHRCVPLSLETDGVMRTDDGYRVWGTADCGESAGHKDATVTGSFTISEEEGQGWTVTINAR